MALQRKGVLQGTFGATTDKQADESDRGPGPARKQGTAQVAEDDPGAGPLTADESAAGRPKTVQPADEPRVAEASGSQNLQQPYIWAREAVERSYRLARRRPRDWGPVPVRLATQAKARLEARRARDHELLGINFAETHYVNAALENIPDDLDEAVRWVEQYLDTLDLKTPQSVGTTGRVLKTTAAKMERISRDIRSHAGYGLVGSLQTAAVIRLLDALDKTDEGAIDLDKIQARRD
jgi:hypothetical protein